MPHEPTQAPPVLACPRCHGTASIGRSIAGCDSHCGWLCDLLTIRAARPVSERAQLGLGELGAMERHALRQLAAEAIEKGMSIIMLAHDVERPNSHVRPEDYTGITTHYWTAYCIPIPAVHGLITPPPPDPTP